MARFELGAVAAARQIQQGLIFLLGCPACAHNFRCAPASCLHTPAVKDVCVALAMHGPLMSPEDVLGCCRHFFCTLTCSPDQSLFANVTAVQRAPDTNAISVLEVILIFIAYL